MARIMYLVNDVDFFLSHRSEIAQAAKVGAEVVVAAGSSASVHEIERLGFRYIEAPFARSGQNFFHELFTLWSIYRILKQEQPDLIHLITIKPVLYGGLISRLASVKAVVAAVSGLGTVFISDSLLSKVRLMLIKALYRAAFKHKNLTVIFQNPDDKEMVINLSGLSEDKAVLIRGSGVSLTDYPYLSEPNCEKTVVVMAARLLIDKGVNEYIKAAQILKDRNIAVEFRLIGSIDAGNNTSLSQNEFDTIRSDGIVKMLGYRNDIAQQYAQANIVCLPSYREGLPKGLVEAAACGRAVVTTDVPGCRDAIVAGETGLLVRVKDCVSLADAIQQLVEDPDRRIQMGKAGRKLAEKAFTIEHVVERHMAIYQELMSRD